MRWRVWGLGVLLAVATVGKSQDRPGPDSGSTLLAAGQFPEALAAFDACLASEVADRQAEIQAECLLGRASTRIMLATLVEAVEDLDALDALSARHGLSRISSHSQLARGRLYALQARFDPADEAFRAAIEMARKLGDAHTEATAWVFRGEAALERRDDETGLSHLRAAGEAASRLEPLAQTRVILAAAETLLRAHREGTVGNPGVNLGSRYAADALALSGSFDDHRIRSLAAGLLAEFYLDSGRTDEALRLGRTAVFHAQQAEAPELAYRWEWLVGRTLRERQSLEEAAAAMERAIQQLSQVRSSLLEGIRGRRQSFRELVGPLFQDHADILLTLSGRSADEDATQQMRARARNVIEAFKSAELQDYFLDECVVDVQEKDTLLDQLSPGTAVLYPILLRDRTEILVSAHGRIHQFTVDGANEAAVSRQAQQLRRSLERRSSHRYRRNARQLYDWLVRPAESVLQSETIDTLVFVPDGALRMVPFGAFHDGTEFLIQRFALATTPGLNLTDPKPIPRSDIRFLVNGLTDAVQGYPALPSVEVELAALERMFAGEQITLLKNQSFVVENIESAIGERPYNVVHFASHGEFQSNVSESFLLTYEEKLSMDRLEDFMRLRRFSEQPVELLTLSACQTAAGDDRAALGLAGIAIKAGARSALGTLWFINDEAASRLISDFYQHLQQADQSKAQALRLAQLQMLEDRRYNHPGYWAPFLLIGNWL